MVSIITVNYNETATTCALLDSILRQGYQDVEIFVVDNASMENPAVLFQEQYPQVTFLRSDRNLGFAGGNNLAIPLARGEYLFFVNNDAEIVPGCIEKLVRLFESQPQAGIASPLICYFPEQSNDAPDTARIVQYAGMTPVSPLTGRNRTLGEREADNGQFKGPRPTAYAHGAAMMLPRRVLEKVGPMWEGFFLYYEELDWCERIRSAGYTVWLEPDALVLHKESLTLNKMGAAKTYYLNRNRLWFMRRNFGMLQRTVFWLFLFLAILPKNILAYSFRGDFVPLKAFLRGVLSGLMPPPQQVS